MEVHRIGELLKYMCDDPSASWRHDDGRPASIFDLVRVAEITGPLYRVRLDDSSGPDSLCWIPEDCLKHPYGYPDDALA